MKTALQPDVLAALGVVSGLVLTRTGETAGARKRYKDVSATPLQIEARTAFRLADAHWQALSLEHKHLWRAWRSWDPLHGYPLCMRCNIPRARSGLPMLSVPPEVPPWH